jgi:hypothetical protein
MHNREYGSTDVIVLSLRNVQATSNSVIERKVLHRNLPNDSVDPGSYQHPLSAGQIRDLGASGGYQHPMSAGQIRDVGASGGYQHPMSAGQIRDLGASGGYQHPMSAGQIRDLGASGCYQHPMTFSF